MALMIAVAKCFVNDTLYQPGDEFEYSGKSGNAFHEKGKERNPVPNLDRMVEAQSGRLTSADAQVQAVDETLKLALEKSYRDVLRLENQLAESQREFRELSDQLTKSNDALEQAMGKIAEQENQAAAKVKK